ncbi:MAG: hypothetical protein JST54_23160 [Deltaproteobacteria bacterium]|nr:hypothetical protein [Deltaproteobacteria bacterium]
MGMREKAIQDLGIRLSIFLAAALATAGCNLAPSQASCDLRPQEPVCNDLLTNRENQLDATLKALCVGTYASEKLCDRTGALGGCECDGCENGKAIEWKFPDPDGGINTADDVKKSCGSETFVSP